MIVAILVLFLAGKPFDTLVVPADQCQRLAEAAQAASSSVTAVCFGDEQ